MQLEAEGASGTRSRRASPASTPLLGSPVGGVFAALPGESELDIQGLSTSRAFSGSHRAQEGMPYTDGDAFEQEKYPPRASGSPGAPLLSSDDDDDASEQHHRRGSIAYSPPASAFHSRMRLHPLTLLPAFILGILLARSGFFGAKTIFKRPQEFVLNSYSIGPTNDVSRLVPQQGSASDDEPTGSTTVTNLHSQLYPPLLRSPLPPPIVPRLRFSILSSLRPSSHRGSSRGPSSNQGPH